MSREDELRGDFESILEEGGCNERLRTAALTGLSLSLARIVDLMEAKRLDFDAYDDSTAPQ